MKRCLRCDHSFDAGTWDCPRCGWTPERRDGFLLFAPECADATPGYSGDRFARNAVHESSSFWFRSRSRLIEHVVRRMSIRGRFIEIGCGSGFVLSGLRRTFPDMKLTGSDTLVEGLRLASERVPGLPLFQCDALRSPYVDHFDGLGAFDVIEHIEEDQIALQQFFRMLRPGGGLILTVPQHRWLWSSHDENARHKRRYERRELVDTLQRTGFDVQYITSFVALLLPVLLLSRWRRRDRRRFKGALAEVDLPGWLQAVLGFVMTLEWLLIRVGIRFRFGGSLLVAAMKPA